MSSKLHRGAAAAEAAPLIFRAAGSPATMRTTVAHPVGLAVAELQERITAASKEAFDAGEAAGAKRAVERSAPVIAAMNSMLQELAALRPRFRAEAEEDTVKLAIAIARRVLHRELATDPEAILGLVKAAFQKINVRELHRLRVSPADAVLLREQRGRLELPEGLEIAADVTLPAGSAIFETTRGQLDASIGTQLGEIDRGFTDMLRRR